VVFLRERKITSIYFGVIEAEVDDIMPTVDFPQSGLIRIKHILHPNGPISVSKSTWWNGVKSGRFPQPIKLGPKTTVWRAKDILALIDNGVDVSENSGGGE